MNQPKITKTWYEFAACWLEDARELNQDSNYTQLALAMGQWDENRPQDEWEYYLVLADNLKTIIDAKTFIVFDGEKYLTTTDTVVGLYEAIQEGYSVWCDGENWSDWFVKLQSKPKPKPKVDEDGLVITTK